MICMMLVMRTETTAFVKEVFESSLWRRHRLGELGNEPRLALLSEIHDTRQVQGLFTVLIDGFIINQRKFAAGQG